MDAAYRADKSLCGGNHDKDQMFQMYAPSGDEAWLLRRAGSSFRLKGSSCCLTQKDKGGPGHRLEYRRLPAKRLSLAGPRDFARCIIPLSMSLSRTASMIS
ncbi:hypothetical protein NS277_16075 [Novosphingobium barchaimii]|nr:hypothetical protein NS277_16075 [Novosphingobium barchaimii]